AVEVGPPSIAAGEFIAIDRVIVLDGRLVDPWKYAISVNIHLRHLAAEKKREVIAELLKAQPEKSDRHIAEQAKSNRTTVGQIRKALERAGDVSIVDTRTDTRGRQQPAKKAAKKVQKKKPAEKKPAESKPIKPVSADARNDIGANSTHEIGQLHVRIQELENEKRQLEIKIEGF